MYFGLDGATQNAPEIDSTDTFPTLSITNPPGLATNDDNLKIDRYRILNLFDTVVTLA